jgi:hypothetical protein
MKNTLTLAVCFVTCATSFSQNVKEADRKKIYDIYTEIAKPYLAALKPVAPSDERNMDKLEYDRAQSVFIDTKFKYAVIGFEKNLKRSDRRDVNQFIKDLSQTIKTELTIQPKFELPEAFYKKAEEKALSALK